MLQSLQMPRELLAAGSSALEVAGYEIEQRALPFRLRRHVEQIWALGAAQSARLTALFPNRPAADRPMISFLVALDGETGQRHLAALLESFRRQPAHLAELLLVVPPDLPQGAARFLEREIGPARARANIVRIAPSRHDPLPSIATALEAASGEWIARLGPRDTLAPHAVACILGDLHAHPQHAFLYTDAVVAASGGSYVDLLLKPGFDPVLLSGMDYVNPLALFRRERLCRLGGWKEEVSDPVADYDLVLRYTTGLAAEEICHLPYPALVWQRPTTPPSRRDIRKSRALVAAHYRPSLGPLRAAAAPRAFARTRLRLEQESLPKVSVIIPSRDSRRLIGKLLHGLRNRTDYPDLEMIVVDNGSKDAKVLRQYGRIAERDPRFRFEIREAPFNYSTMVNRGAALATGEHLLLLNNDIEITQRDWLREMVACLAFPGTGVVGARLLYPDRRLQHAGVIAGLRDLAGHWFCRAESGAEGVMGRLRLRNSMSAVTGACMLISRDCWQRVGPFDDQAFPVAYNDVDFCLRSRAQGFGVVWTPFATLIHHESASRSAPEVAGDHARFAREKRALKERHATERFEDPSFNPWYGRHSLFPRIDTDRELPGGRSFMGFDALAQP
ncbi:MAG: glycosyltransferase [Pseudomonadota bacterium]